MWLTCLKMFQINSIAKQLIHPGNARGSIYKFDSLWTYHSIWPLDHEDHIKFAMQAGSPWWHLYNIYWWPLTLAKVKCLASIARIKSVLWFYPFKKQNNAFLKRAKTKSQIGQKLPKMQPPPRHTPTWHCMPRWWLCHHFWSLRLPQ